MRKFYSKSVAATTVKCLKQNEARLIHLCFLVVALAILLPGKLLAQAPTISYTSPHTYTALTAIAPLTPTSSGVAAPAYNNTPVTIATGFSFGENTQLGVATDAAGNVFVTDQSGGTITKIPAGGGSKVTVATGLNAPLGIAVDAAGALYVVEAGGGDVIKIPSGGGSRVTVASGFSFPYDVAIDAAGNVYVTDVLASSATKIPAGGGASISIGSDFSFARGIAVDGAGNVYVADNGNSVIKKISASDGTITTIGPSFTAVEGIAIDAIGNIYAANIDPGDPYVLKIPADGSSAVTIGSGFTQPVNVSVDGKGNVLVADGGAGVVSKITPAGGYFLNALLPAGLSFNGATGVISGTPTGNSPATNYAITAYNTHGSASAVVNIAVGATSQSHIATLSALALSQGTLSPVFASATNSYSAPVANSVSSITLTPSATDATATIKVNGTAVNTGVASANIPLTVGINIITAVVTAQDGTTTNTYTLTVSRAYPALSSNANLANLAIGSGTLSPTFVSSTVAYAASVKNATTSITLTPTTSDANATALVNGVQVLSGTVSANIALALGVNTIYVVVHAQDGTRRTYTVVVTRLSNNANLAGLSMSSGTISPAFVASALDYTGTVSNATTSIKVTPTTADPKATVTVAGVATPSGAASASIALIGGVNTIYVVVLAQDGTRRTYMINITKPFSSNADLANLTISSGTLSPVFASSTVNYAVTVSSTTSSITLTPSTSDVNATVQVVGRPVKSGMASLAVPLIMGINGINVVVDAQDGTQKVYSLVITRLSNNANLAYLFSGAAALSPAFVSSTVTYTASVVHFITSITVTPTTADNNATVTVNGAAVISGKESAPISLVVGNNTIYIVVTSQEGTRKTYTLTVRKLTPGGLNNLYLPGGDEKTPLTASLNEKVEASNILSPNGDGINDIWVVKNIAFYTDNTVTVYDRTGQVVFTKKGYTNDWDGTYRGSALSEGTYYYLVDLGNGKSMKGFITVVAH